MDLAGARPQGLGSPQLTGQQNHAASKGEHSFHRRGQAQRPRPGKEQRVFEELKEGLCDRQVAVSSRRIIRTRFVFKNVHKKDSNVTEREGVWEEALGGSCQHPGQEILMEEKRSL